MEEHRFVDGKWITRDITEELIKEGILIPKKEKVDWRPLNWERDSFILAMNVTEGGGSNCDPCETIERAADLILGARKELDKTVYAMLCGYRNTLPEGSHPPQADVPHERQIDVCINQLREILGYPTNPPQADILNG